MPNMNLTPADSKLIADAIIAAEEEAAKVERRRLEALGLTRFEIGVIDSLEAQSEARDVPVYDILEAMSRPRRRRSSK